MTKRNSSSLSTNRFNAAKESATKENVVSGVLQNYLDQLLVTATQQPQKVEKVIQIPDEVETAPVTTSVNTAIAEPLSLPKAALISEDCPVDEIIVELISPQEATIGVPSSRLLTDRESWSSQGVECLIFSVCGLKLAVPLLFLGGVHDVIEGSIKPLMGQPAWYLGMVNTDQNNLQVIDTANFIMPERSQPLSEQGFKYLIQLEKTPWAIACQSIDDTVRLEASEIKWRGERGKRTWLAGTVIEKMCALIDVAGLLQTVEFNCKTA